MKYKIVVCTTIESFEKTVTQLLDNGWKLQGGCSVVLIEKTETSIRFHYYQAVIHEGEINAPNWAEG